MTPPRVTIVKSWPQSNPTFDAKAYAAGRWAAQRSIPAIPDGCATWNAARWWWAGYYDEQAKQQERRVA